MEGESIQGLRQIPHPFPLPPCAIPGPLGRRTETVLVVDQPNVTGRPARKRVLAEQVKHLGRPLEQVPQQGHEPVPGALRVERREPHLPIEPRSEEHTSELQSRLHLVCRLLLEKKKKNHLNRMQTYRTAATPTTPAVTHH